MTAPPADVPTSDPAPSLRPPVHRIERKAILWWTLRALAFPGMVLVGAVVAHTVWTDPPAWLTLVLVVVAAATVVTLFVEPYWRYDVHRWEHTDEAVYGLTGWVVREWRVAPISRIQTVDAVRGPIEQVLGLSTLRVTTASSRGAIDIVGLDKQTAEEAAERLTTITQRTPGDAT